jgi:ABC-type lipoprotein export system ATPase subunit
VPGEITAMRIETQHSNGQTPVHTPSFTYGLRKVRKSYGRAEGRREVLDIDELDIRSGVMTAFMGISGSGKTTLLNVIAGLTQPDLDVDGAVLQCRPEPGGDEVDLLSMWRHWFQRSGLTKLRRRHVAMVHQSPNLPAHLTATQAISMLQRLKGSSQQRTTISAQEALDLMRLTAHTHLEGRDLSNAFPEEMSGGERQRVALAAALTTRPRILLADEPTGSLDPENREVVVESLLRITADEGGTVVVVTHDLNVARQAHFIVMLEGGRIWRPGGYAPAIPVGQFETAYNEYLARTDKRQGTKRPQYV